MAITRDVPEGLADYKESILSSLKPSIDLSFSAEDNISIWKSKIGGNPYLPLNESYPCDKAGNPLSLLAQFNLEEVPENLLLPSTGILSFFINGTHSHGIDDIDPTKQDGIKVIYFDNIIKNEEYIWQDFSAINQRRIIDYLPFSTDLQLSVKFDLTQKEISHQDDNFYDVIKSNTNSDSSTLDEYIYQGFFDGSGSHLLGYPKFNQFDPRSDLSFGIQGDYIMSKYYTQEDPKIQPEYFADYILLLQLDSSTDNNDLRKTSDKWKDYGIANFFIHPEDLRNKDFSKVLFNWDYD